MKTFDEIANLNIRTLKGVGESRAKLFEKLGIDTIRALLSHYPRRYLDYTNPIPLAETDSLTPCVSKAKIVVIKPQQFVKKFRIQKVLSTDGNTDLHITFFNNPYAVKTLEVGKEYLFYGTFDGLGPLKRQITAPIFVPADKASGMEPVYPLTTGLSSRMIAAAVKQALTLIETSAAEHTLPVSVEDEYNLCDKIYALKNIHFPESKEALAAAQTRLCVEQLIALQLGLLIRKRVGKISQITPMQYFDMEGYYSKLPFTLTSAQKRAISECTEDLTSDKPMRRLLQGDVGSGKTAVAAGLVWLTAQNGRQSALMAPTEILAKQHFETLYRLLGDSLRIDLLTGSMTAAKRREVKARLISGETDLCIGTHALITGDVEFKDLALVITDEQHRFGVAQRSALSAKGADSHMLVMSATPIPRTLSLIVYGDLDISILDELPPGRQKIETYRINSKIRERAFNFIKKLINDGQQAYIVCPLVAESDNTPENLVAAETYAEDIANSYFKGYKIGLLHAKMKATEKENIMERFSTGEIDLLVSTTVIEVGIDVPNATVMFIENAERFGLSQLHQLRGRVGRGKKQSYCILLSDADGDVAKKRLATMCATSNGFEIAEEDLKLRGPGDFFGNRQHGLPNINISGMITDVELVKRIQNTAKHILETDNDLSLPVNAGLASLVESLFDQIGDGGIS